MKTVMDAVIEFRGSIGAVYDGGLYILYHTEVGTYSLASMGEYERLNYFCDSFTIVCSLNTFNATVTLLSRAPWIKGASLEEYQAADKEVLKMENKTVEVDGMVYEIGKYYLFCDSLGLNEVYDKLDNAYQGEEYGFMADASGPWRRCRAVTGETGAITPATVKLVDGEAYMFECQGEARLGFKFGEYMRIDKHTKFSINRCSNITRLIPKSK